MKKESLEDFLKRGGKIQKVKPGAAAVLGSLDKSKIEKWCLDNTDQVGMDAVLITATTKSSDPIDLAARVSRVRGKIILVGVTGIAIKRDLFYVK